MRKYYRSDGWVEILYRIVSDLYRISASLLDWQCHLRLLSQKPLFDVLCITNFENKKQQNFIGLNTKKKFAYGLRFSVKGKLARYGLINSNSQKLAEGNRERSEAKENALAIIDDAVEKGAQIILFAASLKRLFILDEIMKLHRKYPSITITIGDNGTAVCLLNDTFQAIEDNDLNRFSRIAITGPNGHLGSFIKNKLSEKGFNNILSVSSAHEIPFAGVRKANLIITCSHFKNVRPTAEIIKKITDDENRISIVDVCRPSAVSKKEYYKVLNEGVKIDRRDAGNTLNNNIRYVFKLGAIFVLKDLMLSHNRLYGCFSEATALSFLNKGKRAEIDLLSVNDEAMEAVREAFGLAGFEQSPARNYGNLPGIEAM